MPKTKAPKDSEELDIEKAKTEPKDVLIDDEEKILVGEDELIPGSAVVDEDAEEEDASGLDDDEVDPFKDKWEE